MLTGVWQVGNVVPPANEGSFQDVSDGGKNRHCLKIVFEKEENSINFKEVAYEEFSVEKISKYAYVKGSSSGGDITPTSKLTEPDKTLKRLSNSINYLIDIDTNDSSNELFKDISIQYKKDLSKIVEEVKFKKDSVSAKKNEGFFVTLTIIENGNELYLGDFEAVIKKINNISTEKYYSKYETISKGLNTCYFCREKKEVYGFVNTYNSYTVNDCEFATGGFKKEKSWINYPVCCECAIKLENGRNFIDKFMTKKFCGFNYSVIPKLSFNNKEDIVEIIEIFKDYENEKFSLNSSTSMSLLQSERDFLDVMSESKNNLNYNIFIFKEDKAAFKILAYIEDIVPSKLKQILRKKLEVDNEDYFKELPGKDSSTYNLYYTFEYLRKFFPNNKKEGNFDKNFLEIVNNVFTGRKISYDLLLSRMMDVVSSSFLEGLNIDSDILKGLMNIRFFDKLGLLNKKMIGGNVIMITKNEKNAAYLDYLEQHSDTFDNDFKKAVFLTGVLVKKLLNIQYQNSGDNKNSPFYSRLNGLKLNENILKRIYSEAINKLNEYNKNYYEELESLIAEYMLTKNELSDDEISFFFTLGLSLCRKFKNEREENKND